MSTPRASLMKHVNKFINEYTGTRYQESALFGYQCVALVKFFYRNVIGYPLPSFGGSAIHAWKNSNWDGFTKVYNKWNNYPQVGDILFWDRGSFGHTAICVRANLLSVTYIEQNGGQGTGTGIGNDAIRVKTSSYKNIVGWSKFNLLDKETGLKD